MKNYNTIVDESCDVSQFTSACFIAITISCAKIQVLTY